MDFMNLLKSFEDFVFEIVSWLYFYPRTMWLSLVRPSQMMAYADDELDDRPAERYESTISPPLFLLITILLATWMNNVISGPDSAGDTPVFLQDWKNDILFTATIYSIYPLVLSLALLICRKQNIERRSLRPPFYSQCFVASPFAMMNALAIALFVLDDETAMIAGLAIFAAALVWYAVLQTRWFTSELKVSTLHAAGVAGTAIVVGFAITGSIIVLVFN